MSKENVRGMHDELISKKAAIDALRTCYDTETITMDNGDEFINYGDAVGEIEQLPPIQPEIVRCEDCEHGVLDDGFPHQYFCVFKGDEWNNADYFCGHAERREVTT